VFNTDLFTAPNPQGNTNNPPAIGNNPEKSKYALMMVQLAYTDVSP
jgi:hypothetical protein